MDTLITQSDLAKHFELGKKLSEISEAQAKLRATPEYLALNLEAAEAAKGQAEIEKRLLEAATKALALGVEAEEKGKSKYPNLDAVTEAGAYRCVARFGTSDTTAWKKVVEKIEEKNCLYPNGGGKLSPLNSVLAALVSGQTDTKDTKGVTVELRK